MSNLLSLNSILRSLDIYLGENQLRYTFCFSFSIEHYLYLAFRVIDNYSGSLNFNWRNNWSHIEVYAYRLDAQRFELGVSILGEFDSLDRRFSIEDPRMQITAERINLICCSWGTHRKPFQTVFGLTKNLEVVDCCIPNFNQNGIGHPEKNWVPFSGIPYFVYSLCPKVTILDSSWCLYLEGPGIEWEYGKPHCGSNLVFYREHWIGFFHSSIDSERSSLFKYPSIYKLGVYALKNVEGEGIRIQLKEASSLFPESSTDRFFPGSASVKVCFAFEILSSAVVIGLGIDDCSCRFEMITLDRWDNFLDELLFDRVEDGDRSID